MFMQNNIKFDMGAGQVVKNNAMKGLRENRAGLEDPKFSAS